MSTGFSVSTAISEENEITDAVRINQPWWKYLLIHGVVTAFHMKLGMPAKAANFWGGLTASWIYKCDKYAM